MPPDTIYALSTPPGVGALAIVRLSGPHSLAALAALTDKKDFTPRMAVRITLHAPQTQKVLDDAVAIAYVAPHSFTGEDAVELMLHGGRAVARGVLDALGALPGLRLAQPGEFTRRAFENGKMDLTQAEAIADLIHAETSLQRDQALGQLDGNLSALYHGWSESLAHILAHAEADIDFPDEDLPDALAASLHPQITALHRAIHAHLNDARRGERLRDGITIAIIGAPNAGKSTLLNALAQREAAIVTPTAGTTRDVIEVHMDLGDYPVTLLDTAGLRETTDSVEAEGIRRARARAAAADLKLCLFDSTCAPDDETAAMVDTGSLVIISKRDLGNWELGTRNWELEIGKRANTSQPPLSHLPPYQFPVPNLPIPISATTGQGLPELLAAITARLSALFDAPRGAPSLTRARHREALCESADCLGRALAAPSPELLAEDLRLALRALGRITGRVDVEDLLDKIFSEFCIGK